MLVLFLPLKTNVLRITGLEIFTLLDVLLKKKKVTLFFEKAKRNVTKPFSLVEIKNNFYATVIVQNNCPIFYLYNERYF